MKTVLIALVAFASTNIDDFFLLSLWFLRRTRTPVVVLGQLIGFTALLAASVLGYFGTTLLPQHSVHWMGLLPIAIGIKQLYSKETHENATADSWISVATLTVANGGDNIAVYVPLLARYDLKNVLLIVLCFYAGLFVLVLLARLATQPLAQSDVMHRIAHRLAPFVIIAIGVAILLNR